MKAIVVAALIALAAPPLADADIIVPGDQRATEFVNSRADKWGVPLPGGPVTLYIDECPDGRSVGCSDGDSVWAGRDVWRHEVLLAHEVGHVFDEHQLNDRDRRFFTRMLGLRPGRVWFGERGSRSPGELFADAYSACARRLHFYPGGWTHRQRTHGGAIRGGGEMMYGYAPKPARHRRICRAIRREASSD